MRTTFIAGNWKMNKTIAEAKAFAEAVKGEAVPSGKKAAICAPFTQLAVLQEALQNSSIAVGAQNVGFAESGAYTGEVSPAMLQELGLPYCIVGHSERREYFNETDETVNTKLKLLYQHGILPILCVGERLETRESGKAFDWVTAQIRADLAGLTADQVRALTVAYEPIWAIGTGKTATPADAQNMAKAIRDQIAALYDSETAEAVTIQYGGSVKPDNIGRLLEEPDVDGALVGGASLDPASFLALLRG